MALDRPRVADFVKETTDTEGVGAFTLAGPVPGFRSFSVLSDGAKVYYSVVDNPDAITDFEQGIGTYTAGSPATVSRDRVISSSNGNARVSWAPGTKTIIITAAAELLNAILDTVDSDLKTTGTATAYSLTTYRPDVGLFEGRFVCAKFHVANGASPTLDVDGTGGKAIVDINGSTPPAGSMPASYYFLKYDATAEKWVVFSPFNMGTASSKNLGADIIDDGSGNLTTSKRYFSKNDNFSFVIGDRCKRIRMGAVGKTATLLAAGTAGAGWNIEIEDAAGGNILSSPATDIYANGLAPASSYTFSRGEFGTLVCTGTGYLLSTTKPAASTSYPGAVQLADSTALLARTANRVPDASVLSKNIRPLLATLAASNSASLAFTGFDSTKYAAYEFIFDKLVAASACVFNTQFSIDGGSTYLTTGYAHNARLIAIGTTASDIGSNSDVAVRLTSSGGNDINPSYGLSGVATVKPAAAAYGNSLIGQVHFIRNGGTALESMIGISGTNSTASIMNAIQFFFFTSGGAAVNMVSGNIYVYGIPK